jgi:hypothetical protein
VKADRSRLAARVTVRAARRAGVDLEGIKAVALWHPVLENLREYRKVNLKTT